MLHGGGPPRLGVDPLCFRFALGLALTGALTAADAGIGRGLDEADREPERGFGANPRRRSAGPRPVMSTGAARKRAGEDEDEDGVGEAHGPGLRNPRARARGWKARTFRRFEQGAGPAELLTDAANSCTVGAGEMMAIPRKTKLYLILAPIAALLLFFGWEGLRVWWYRAYSVGTRTGVVRKISVRGPPYCKYLAGEMAVQAANTTMQAEVWEFSVDDDGENAPVVIALHDAEKKGERITLKYRQDLHSLFRCTPSEYFVTAVEK